MMDSFKWENNTDLELIYTQMDKNFPEIFNTERYKAMDVSMENNK